MKMLSLLILLIGTIHVSAEWRNVTYDESSGRIKEFLLNSTDCDFSQQGKTCNDVNSTLLNIYLEVEISNDNASTKTGNASVLPCNVICISSHDQSLHINNGMYQTKTNDAVSSGGNSTYYVSCHDGLTNSTSGNGTANTTTIGGSSNATSSDEMSNSTAISGSNTTAFHPLFYFHIEQVAHAISSEGANLVHNSSSKYQANSSFISEPEQAIGFMLDKINSTILDTSSNATDIKLTMEVNQHNQSNNLLSMSRTCCIVDGNSTTTQRCNVTCSMQNVSRILEITSLDNRPANPRSIIYALLHNANLSDVIYPNSSYLLTCFINVRSMSCH